MLHRQAIPSFLAMREAARGEGIDLQAASSFRDFDRQVAIWNGKYLGERPLLDRTGRTLSAVDLSPEERVETILLWSALPGASRHHWGTDFDVFDAAAMPDRSQLQLMTEKYASDGPFARLTAWLDTHMHRFGFFRPYVDPGDGTISGGVSPEPWHLSFAPLSTHFLNQLTVAVLSRAIASSSIEGREIVMARIDELHRRFVANVATTPAALLAMELGDHGRMV
ncbi:MAG: M15 family metallopeptidase [Gammaproteobacteria bacterium]